MEHHRIILKAFKKYASKRVILRQKAKIGQNFVLSLLKSTPAWKSTPPSVVTVVTNISYDDLGLDIVDEVDAVQGNHDQDPTWDQSPYCSLSFALPIRSFRLRAITPSSTRLSEMNRALDINNHLRSIDLFGSNNHPEWSQNEVKMKSECSQNVVRMQSEYDQNVVRMWSECDCGWEKLIYH